MNYKHLLIIITVGIVAFCINNTSIVPDIMESRNLITAREMVNDGNWIITTMNGDLRLEKPPLPTWIAAFTQMIFGDSWEAFRFIPGIMGLLMLISLYKLTFKMTGDTKLSLCASLILATCYNFILASRTVSWDIYCHSFMLMSIYFQYKLLQDKEKTWYNATLVAILFGCSLMSKGPVSVYALWLPFVIAYILLCRKNSKRDIFPAIPVVYAVILALIVGGTWYGYVWAKESVAGLATLSQESGSWINRNVRPWYYYATFFTETGIWALLCISSFAVWFWQKRVSNKGNYLFAFTWMLSTVVLLSCLPEKKNRYLLPVLVPASLSMAHLITYWIKTLSAKGKNKASSEVLDKEDKGAKIFYYINAYLIAVVALAVSIICAAGAFIKKIDPIEGTILAAVIFAISISLFFAASRKNAKQLIISVVLLFAAIEVEGMPVLAKFFSNTEYTSPKEIIVKDYAGLYAFYPKDDDLRIELVYDLGIEAHAMDLTNKDNVDCHRPFLLVVPGGTTMPEAPKMMGNAHYIGHYNGNRNSTYTSGGRTNFSYDLYYVK